jgi:hypothetical protein
MTRDEAKAFIDAFVKLRNLVADELALEVSVLYPTWKENIAYKINTRILYNNVLYKVLIAHTSQADWTPDISTSLFAKVLIPDENVIPEWAQPESTNSYSNGDKVMHNGKIWISIVDNNSWEPGVYGWEEAAE